MISLSFDTTNELAFSSSFFAAADNSSADGGFDRCCDSILLF
jgi:hypothetical protein